MLRDLRIQNYRCFEDFYIEGLAPVNLIVGKNSIGKTCFLEAIQLLKRPGYGLINILNGRSSKYNNMGFYGTEDFEKIDIKYSLEEIFFDLDVNRTIYIGFGSEKDIEFDFLKLKKTFGSKSFSLSAYIEYHKKNNNEKDKKRFNILESKQKERDSSFFISDLENTWIPVDIINSESILLTENLDFFQLLRLWNQITLTEKEKTISEFLKIIEPEIERINFIVTNPKILDFGQILVKMKNRDNPSLIESMGDGMMRLLTLAMLAVTVENGYLLVDEIDTGLHYEVQAKMWKLLMKAAKQLNIQVFATTHSWDCIEAFQEAMEELEDESIGKLFRISNKYGKLRSVEYDANSIEIAVRQGIEVR